MAVVDRKSTFITNADASPPTKNDSTLRGVVHETIGAITPATDDSANSIGRLVRVPSNARVTALTVTSADFTTAGAADIGVYRTSGDGGAVVDADFFASALDFSGGPFAELTVLVESTVNTQAKQVQPLWEAIGLSSDPGGELDIAYTITTAFNGGQPILMKCKYVI